MNASVPLEAESPEHRDELLRESRDAALPVEVVNPEQPAALLAARAQVAARRGEQRAEMQGT
jgi:hypothetical protein